MEISRLSTEYVLAKVEARNNGALIDPTVYGVEVAVVLADAEPVAGDWTAADWETDGDDYFARFLVSALDVGTYVYWVRIDAAPEQPVKAAGQIVVT